MGRLLFAVLLAALGACASSPSPGPASPMDLDAALLAEGMHGETIDLNADLARGLPVALVFWQAW